MMLTLQHAREIIARSIDNLQLLQDPKELYEPADYILKLEGKRLRPSLVLLACDLFGHDIEKAINPALAIEVFHNFTLVHDDLMDQADMRRNNTTVHKKWHENIAILSGDAMLIKAYELLIKTAPTYVIPLIKSFNNIALKVCEGQQYDMNFENRDHVDEKEYIKMISLKTAALVAGSLKIGALLGDATENQLQTIERFGEDIGIAFQLQDDYLDVYGEKEQFGKNIGGDIVANKKTYLLIKTLELSREKNDHRLTNELQKKGVEKEEKINTVTCIYNDYGIREHTTRKISEYTQKAYRALDGLNVGEDKKQELKALVGLLDNRMK
jgi:geranylgeranyl diphosphate synthase, type II